VVRLEESRANNFPLVWRLLLIPNDFASRKKKNDFVTATKLRTTNTYFVAATKNLAAATKRFVDRTKNFVVVTKYFCYPYFNKWFCWFNKTFSTVFIFNPEPMQKALIQRGRRAKGSIFTSMSVEQIDFFLPMKGTSVFVTETKFTDS